MTKISWGLDEGDESVFVECVKDFYLFITGYNKLFEYFHLLLNLYFKCFFFICSYKGMFYFVAKIDIGDLKCKYTT